MIIDAPDSYKGRVDGDGCGPVRFPFDFVPDHLPGGLDVAVACSVHDHEYGLGGTPADRSTADARFKRNLIAIVDDRGGFLRWPRRVFALVYFAGVRLFGRSSFG